jgi:hypothetical protein
MQVDNNEMPKSGVGYSSLMVVLADIVRLAELNGFVTVQEVVDGLPDGFPDASLEKLLAIMDLLEIKLLDLDDIGLYKRVVARRNENGAQAPRAAGPDEGVSCSVAGGDKSTELMRAGVDKILRCLTDQEREVIVLRFGLLDGVLHSREEVWRILKTSLDAVVEAERSALRKMRHPTLMRQLQGMFEGSLDDVAHPLRRPSPDELPRLDDSGSPSATLMAFRKGEKNDSLV